MKKKPPKVLDKAIGAARGAMQVVRAIGRQARPGGRQALAPLTLRSAGEADLPRLLALQLQVQGPTIDDGATALARWRAIGAAGATLWLIEAGPQLLGAAVLHLLPSLGQGGRPLALLADLVVDPHARHRGVTRHLIQALGEQAHAAGAAQLELSMARAGRGRREVLHRLDRVMLPLGEPG